MSGKPQSITKRQEEVLTFIKAFANFSGYPPTCAEIARHFGFASENSVTCHLKNLARHGRIKVTPKISRGIKVIR